MSERRTERDDREEKSQSITTITAPPFSAYEISTEKYLLDFFVFPSLVSVSICIYMYLCVLCVCVLVFRFISFSPISYAMRPESISFIQLQSLSLLTSFRSVHILNLCYCASVCVCVPVQII